MNYKIIQDEKRLLEFINWLPELGKDEQFYGCLFARKKYDPTGVVTSDKGQIKRFTATKDYLYQKIRQLETAVGTYQFNGQAVPQEALALYIMPNPRSLINATKKSLKDFADILTVPDLKHKNPHKIVLTNIQKSVSRKIWMDFDIDIKKEKDTLINLKNRFSHLINEECVTYIETRGGYHILIEIGKIDEQYKKSWYQSIRTYPDIDVSGDVLLPVVGATQGNFIPKFV